MRKRIENRLRKAIRIFSQLEPSFALRCRRLERTGRTLEESLVAITADRQALVRERDLAAQLLVLAGHPRPYRPLIEHFLDSDWSNAWDLVNSLGASRPLLSAKEERKLGGIIREDPVEERRAAAIVFLQHVKTAGGTRMLIEALENHAETANVRSHAAEALRFSDDPAAAAEACIRCLADPDPKVRFWAVFGLGGIVQFQPRLHSLAIAALQPMVKDTAEMPGYWSVGLEARAMLEYMIPGMQTPGEQERDTILVNANAPAEMRRWAAFYSHKDSAKESSRTVITARYKNLCWSRSKG